uniref:Fungal lipase-type domain-containing protein n=1 Tax=Oryza brachyantha TaxID=4533 RepID=J3NE24_ORYBR
MHECKSQDIVSCSKHSTFNNFNLFNCLASLLSAFIVGEGNLQHEYAGSNSQLLEGPEVKEELISLLGYLKLCMYFSKKPYKVFMEFGEYDESDVLIKKSKARLMKPSFTVVRDRSAKCFFLFIRGAISVKDRLTAATGAEVPFHHVVAQDGCVSKLVLGHAHCGMVVAARWIAKQAIPCLSEAIAQFPEYGVKIIGHSMGAGIAAILTYILRENEKLSSSTCIAFGPAACMTWDLAESGKDFITTIVNRNDLVPSFGKVSAAKLRTEVMASSWVHDLREQIQQTRFLGFVNRSVSFIRSHTPFVSDPRSKVVDVDMLVPNNSEAEVKTSSNSDAVVKKRHALACWSCVAAVQKQSTAKHGTHDMTNQTDVDAKAEKIDIQAAQLVSISMQELDLQESDNDDDDTDRGGKAPATNETDEDQAMELLETLTEPSSSSHCQEPRQLYPPGRIMHMVGLPCSEPNTSEQGGREEAVALYETPRHLYSKIRLARSMIREHYMPKYIRTMELLIDKLNLAQDIDSDQLGSL